MLTAGIHRHLAVVWGGPSVYILPVVLVGRSE